jgi:SiaC family regulatory phosphoprotein
MRPLDIAPTKNTPLVKYFEPIKTLEINGESYPENAVEFFKPLLAWLREFCLETNEPVVINLKLTYFNTSSSKCLLDLLNVLEDFHQQGKKIQVTWSYQASDEDMMESGQEFAEGLAVPFELKAY